MILKLTNNALSTTDYNVQIKNGFTSEYLQEVDYIESMNGLTQSYDNGSTFDKWNSVIIIEGLKADVFTLATALENTVNQAEITTESGELIFGAGIDYTNTFICNITKNDIPYPRMNTQLAELTLSLSAISSNGIQLAYQASLSGALPSLNYQTPVPRVIKISNTAFISEEFGSFGNTVTVGSSSLPAHKHEFNLTFSQNEEDTGNIEKFYSVQRSIPFLWTGLDCLELFNDVATENVMITKFSSTHIENNNWKVDLTIITNV